MKKILMVSVFSLPCVSPGSFRACKLAKYLSRLGWDVTLLTMDWTRENSAPYCYDEKFDSAAQGYKIASAQAGPLLSSKFYKRVISNLRPYHTPPGLMKNMIARGRALLASGDFDLIWSTYSPGLSHVVANRLAKEFSLPWMADFRDLPDQNVAVPFGGVGRIIRQEVKTTRGATVINGVNPCLIPKLTDRYTQPVLNITNGYDPEDFPADTEIADDKFTLGYYGTIYKPEHFKPFWKGLDLLADEKPEIIADIKIRFFGLNNHLCDVSKYSWQNHVEFNGPISSTQACVAQQRDAVLLMDSYPESNGLYPSKFFSYLGAARPILCIPEDSGCMGKILQKSGTGVATQDPRKIAELLAIWYGQWKNSGRVEYNCDEAVRQSFAYPQIAENLAGELEQMISDSQEAGR